MAKSSLSKSRLNKQTKSPYHHGDLQASLLTTAMKMINKNGLESLSLRKLAENVGVSRTATYHHFKDKNNLLCSIAARGFIQWRERSDAIFQNSALTNHEKYRQFVYAYVHFATQNPALYELMFGRTLWKSDQSTQVLQKVAHPSFQYQLEMTKIWQQQGLLNNKEDTLRVTQVTWATLHGIAHLLIDGIYANADSIDEMCNCAVNLFLINKV